MSKRIQTSVPDGLFAWLEAEARARGVLRGGQPNIGAMAAIKLQMLWEQALAEGTAPLPEPHGKRRGR